MTNLPLSSACRGVWDETKEGTPSPVSGEAVPTSPHAIPAHPFIMQHLSTAFDTRSCRSESSRHGHLMVTIHGETYSQYRLLPNTQHALQRSLQGAERACATVTDAVAALGLLYTCFQKTSGDVYARYTSITSLCRSTRERRLLTRNDGTDCEKRKITIKGYEHYEDWR